MTDVMTVPMPATRAYRYLVFAPIAALLSVSLALASAELLLRLNGRRPWKYLGVDAREPVMHEPDPLLGWRAKPGTYVVPPYQRGSPAIRLTFLEDGTRSTSARDGDGRSKLLFVGCSLTQGWAISDDETFAWKIQQRFPTLHVVNYGTSGYGTYQNLMVLERLFSQPDPPRLVYYGFMEEHEGRNVAHPLWLMLLALLSKRGAVATPYCTLDADGRLVRHPPERYPAWPLREHLATVAFLENRYVNFTAGGRASQARAVTERLLLEMQRLVRENGARLRVVLLHFSPPAKAHYVPFLEQHGIDLIDCAYPITGAMMVPGEGHPNGQMNSRWAECIAERVKTDAAIE